MKNKHGLTIWNYSFYQDAGGQNWMVKDRDADKDGKILAVEMSSRLVFEGRTLRINPDRFIVEHDLPT